MIAPAPTISKHDGKDAVVAVGPTRPSSKRSHIEAPQYLSKAPARRVIFPSYKRPVKEVLALPKLTLAPAPTSSNRSMSETTYDMFLPPNGQREEQVKPKFQDVPLRALSTFQSFFMQGYGGGAPIKLVPNIVSPVSVRDTNTSTNDSDNIGKSHRLDLPLQEAFSAPRVITPEVKATERSNLLPMIIEEVFTLLSKSESSVKTNASPPAKVPHKPLRSILRSKTYASLDENKVQVSKVPSMVEMSKVPSMVEVTKIPSVDSDMPSLASSVGNDSQSSSCDCEEGVTCTLKQHHRAGKCISFDARIWVCEFERVAGECEATWYSAKDLQGFKQEAIQRILQYTKQSQLIPTGTGRTVNLQTPSRSRALFSHIALRALDGEKDTTTSRDPGFRQAVLENEIRNILLVDPHDIFLKLFTKALKSAMPHVTVTACTSSEEAMEHFDPASGKKRRFDLVIIEERLKIFHRQHRNGGATERHGHDYGSAKDHHASGSALLRTLSSGDSKSVFVGVSARLAEDGDRLKESGADFCWSKPPPPMNQVLIDDLLRALLLKRGRSTVVSELFG